MSAPSYEHLKTIWFERELLPKWAQLLDLAAKLSLMSEVERKWFTRFAKASGVDDSRTVLVRCEALKAAIQGRGALLFTELQKSGFDAEPAQIIAGWLYALDTMIQVAKEAKTCSWTVEGSENVTASDWVGEVS
jgi:hypothetical protein